MVSEGTEEADSALGLIEQVGISGVTTEEVTAQERSTVPVKPVKVVKVTLDVADPPGSIDDGTSGAAVSVNVACPKARADAATIKNNRNVKTSERRTGLISMNGRELTTFDSSTGANAAPRGTKDFRTR